MTKEANKANPRPYTEITPDPVDQLSDFKFADMKPNESLRSEVKGLIRRIYEQTPDGSVIIGTLKKVKSGYKGALKIVHGGGQFIAEGIQKSADETLHLLESQIWSKIRRWRKTRFQNEPDQSYEPG